MANVVVVGAQWGDEGKGKIVDWLSERADVVVRFQGGHNAGHTLVIGGCTLNSCVRISSLETLAFFKDMDLEVVVDVSICGARLRNFSPSAMYAGRSAVASTVQQMAAAGIRVVRRIEWN